MLSVIEGARNNARLVRTALTREVWEATNECWMTLKEALRTQISDKDLPDVLSLIRQSRGGELYDSRFGARFRGEGAFAELLAQRFALAIRRLGLQRRQAQQLDCSRFAPPGGQLALL